MNMDYKAWKENKQNKPFIETIDVMSDIQKNKASKKFMDMLKVIEAIRTFTLNGEGVSTRLMDLLEGVHFQATGEHATPLIWLRQACENTEKIQAIMGDQENEVRALTAFLMMGGVFSGFPVELLDSVEEESEHVLTYMDVL
jgi:hypothetical protein